MTTKIGSSIYWPPVCIIVEQFNFHIWHSNLSKSKVIIILNFHVAVHLNTAALDNSKNGNSLFSALPMIRLRNSCINETLIQRNFPTALQQKMNLTTSVGKKEPWMRKRWCKMSPCCLGHRKSTYPGTGLTPEGRYRQNLSLTQIIQQFMQPFFFFSFCLKRGRSAPHTFQEQGHQDMTLRTDISKRKRFSNIFYSSTQNCK